MTSRVVRRAAWRRRLRSRPRSETVAGALLRFQPVAKRLGVLHEPLALGRGAWSAAPIRASVASKVQLALRPFVASAGRFQELDAVGAHEGGEAGLRVPAAKNRTGLGPDPVTVCSRNPLRVGG
jgi:hypothetical protein